MSDKPSGHGGRRPGSGRPKKEIQRKVKTLRLIDEVIGIIDAQPHSGEFIEELVLAWEKHRLELEGEHGDNSVKNYKNAAGEEECEP